MENIVPKNQKKLSYDPIFAITVAGFILRLIFLIFILTVGREFTTPYLVVDDAKYESLADAYISSARFLIDMPLFNKLTAGYLQSFWPFVMCISGYIFKSVFAGRFINIILSSLCIPIIYSITIKISGNKKTATLASSLFAFMPLTVITCAYPIKDLLITFGFFYISNIFIDLQKKIKISVFRKILTVLHFLLIYFTRGAVTELLLLCFAAYYILKFAKEKNHLALVGVCLASIIVLILFGAEVFASFNSKIDTYANYGGQGDGIAFLKIKSITDIYKLPFTYFFASFQPMRLNLFTSLGSTLWLDVLTYLNISAFPIAIGNFLYIFTKKKNFFFWLFTTLFFCAVILLSLGIFRHYLFLLPVQYINFALFIEKNRHTNTVLCISCSVMFLCMIFLLSML